MKTIGTLLTVIVVAFIAVLGFYWVDRGSLEEAGREVDSGLSQIDRSTAPLQEGMKEMGDATVQTIERATDGDDAT